MPSSWTGSPTQTVPDPPAYRIPEVPDTAWTAAPSPRRTWISRGVLAGVLAIQALLSLRLSNTAFQDEALYLYAGRLHLDNMLHGTPVDPNYADYFSGSPYFYPALAALIDQVGGLEGARAFSLLLMLGTTGCLYAFTRRLFNERVGLFAAGSFAVVESTLVLGRYATYDAIAVFLLCAATALAVRGAQGSIGWCLLAAPVAGLAVPMKYASALYLPTIVVLATLAAVPCQPRWKALLRGPLLAVLIAVLTVAAFAVTGTLEGLTSTTTAREAGTDSPWRVLGLSAEYGAVLTAAAALGTVLYARQGRMNESPVVGAPVPGGWWRAAVGTLLTATALLAPAYQAHLHTTVSLHKHVGYGLLFAAPMAGVGVSRLIGAHFRHPQLGILVWTVLLVMGMSQSQNLYASWPNSTRLMQVLDRHVTSRGYYLSAVPQIPIYYLGERTRPGQWASTYYFQVRTRGGRKLVGDPAYRAAIRDRRFDLVVLSHHETVRVDRLIAEEMRRTGGYRLLARLPYRVSSGPGRFEVWGRVRA
ncbi:ArnT family glycosyltransferase [Spirillospora sp. CA-253888]